MNQRTSTIATAAGLSLLAVAFGYAAIAHSAEGDGTAVAPAPAAAPDCPGHPGGMGGPGGYSPMTGHMGHGPGGPGGPGGGSPMMAGAMGQCCQGGPGSGPGMGAGHRGRGPGGMGGPGGQMPPDAVLKEAFGLTDAQLAGLKTLHETRQASFESLQKQMADGRKALEDSLKAEKPDAAKVGNALIAIRGYEKQMPKIEESFKTGFKALLTPEQKKKLAEIETVRAAQALRHAGL